MAVFRVPALNFGRVIAQINRLCRQLGGGVARLFARERIDGHGERAAVAVYARQQHGIRAARTRAGDGVFVKREDIRVADRVKARARGPNRVLLGEHAVWRGGGGAVDERREGGGRFGR